MAKNPPLFLNTTNGRHERLDINGDFLEIDKIDCTAANAVVNVYPTVNSTGTVTLFSAHNGTANVGAIGGTFALAGGLSVAQNSLFTGNVTVNGNTQLGNLLTADTVTFTSKIASSLVFTDTAPRTVEVTSQDLTVKTVTGGTLAVTSAAALTMTGATSASLTATSTSLTLSANTTASLTAGAASALTLGNFGATIPLSAAAPNNALIGFSATTIITALNELRASVHDTVPSAIAGEAITKGDLICLDDDAGTPKLYKCDSALATRNRPVGVSISTGVVAPGSSVSYTTVGDVIVNSALLTASHGEYVFMDANPNQGLVTVSPPVAGTVMIVGVVSFGAAAGTARIIYQPLLPTTF